jgi:predicted enzyme related to lactoylglutathione lyase
MELIVAWYGVSDMERAKKFYGETLGLRKTFEMRGWTEFSHAEGAPSIGLNSAPKDAPAASAGRNSGATVVLRVADIEQKQRELASRGVQFEGKLEEVPGVVKIATFRDADGNRLQLCQVLAQA